MMLGEVLFQNYIFKNVATDQDDLGRLRDPLKTCDIKVTWLSLDISTGRPTRQPRGTLSLEKNRLKGS